MLSRCEKKKYLGFGNRCLDFGIQNSSIGESPLGNGDGAGVDKGSVWEEGGSLNAVSSSQVVTAIHQGGAKFCVKTLIFTGTVCSAGSCWRGARPRSFLMYRRY